VRFKAQPRSGIIWLGERSVRKFFEHRMTTFAAALAYRGLFGLFPLILILVVLVGVFGLPDFFDRLIGLGASQQVPRPLEPVVEQGRVQGQSLRRMVEQAQERAAGELLFFGLAVALWSVSALARTLIEAFNTAYEVPETRPGWKRGALSVAFGPVLALMAIVSVGLMLIGPRLVERIAEGIGLDELVVLLWGWLRLPVALLLLATALAFVYRFGPDARQRFRSVVVGLPGELRRLRSDLREPGSGRGAALLPVSLSIGGVAGSGGQRGDLPCGSGRRIGSGDTRRSRQGPTESRRGRLKDVRNGTSAGIERRLFGCRIPRWN
jgi:membrane protein